MYDIKKDIKCLFDIEEVSLIEFGKKVDIEFSAKKVPNEVNLKKIISNIISRDKITMTLTSPDEEILVLENHNLENFENNYNQFVTRLQEDDDIRCFIEIEKIVENNCFSIYNWETFSSYLCEKSLVEILGSFNFLLRNKNFLYFEVLDKDIQWNTKTLMFCSNKETIFKPLVNRQSILRNAQEVSCFYNDFDIKLTPDDFIIINDYKNNTLREKFNNIATLLSISYISNQSKLVDNKFNCQIIGQRSIEYNYNLSDIMTNLELIKIYEWIYSNDNVIDKAIISRNIISLHCKFCDLLSTDGKTFSSIQSNYRIYLKDNVNKFLEAKEVVTKFICDITLQIGSDATKLLNDFKNNIFAIFGFLLTVFIANVSSEQPLDNIFTTDIVTLLFIILYGSIFYFIICLIECLYKYYKNNLAYSNLKDSYKDVFTEEDFKNIFESDKKFENAKTSVMLGILILSLIWIICIAASFNILYKI